MLLIAILTPNQEKRLLIKDMAQYFIPPNGRPTSIAPSLGFKRRGIGTDHGDKPPPPARRGSLKTEADIPSGVAPAHGAPYQTYTEPGNPTVIPSKLLEQFQFAFLIRHPKSSIPSYYRCCIPPLNEMTGFEGFRSDEAGYVELRRLFDHLREKGMIGPAMAGDMKGPVNGESKHMTTAPICVIDADDLLDKPAQVLKVFCNSVFIQFDEGMLKWDSDEEEEHAARAFEKWKGFHEDVIHSRDLKPRGHVSFLCP